MEKKKLVSIVMASYNSDEFIGEAIESILNQSYSDWELLIIDDCSTDKSIEVIEGYCSKDDRIKLFQNSSNNGPAVTRNVGIEAAEGQYLTFLDSDDLWVSDFLEKSLKFMHDKECHFVFSSYYRWYYGSDKVDDIFEVPEKATYQSLLKTCPISCLTSVINIKELGKYYMPEIDKRQDYGLWLRILKDYPYALGIKEPLATYRIRPNSVSRNKFKAMYYVWLVYRDLEGMGVIKSFYYLTRYAINGYKKYK